MSGKYFEELEVGMEFNHLPHRTITETDNLLFTASILLARLWLNQKSRTKKGRKFN